MRLLLVLLAALSVTAHAEVRLQVELGWDGRAVSGEVNPLWVELVNEGAAPTSGTLVVHQRAGSAWRGESDWWMTLPVALTPGGRARRVLPWPVAPGSRKITVSYESGGEEVFAVDVPVALTALPVTLHVGTPSGAVAPSAVVLHPRDLPSDPLVYGGVTGIELGDGIVLSPALEDVMDVWRVLISAQAGGASPVPHPSGEQIRDAFARAELNGSVWWWYAAGTLVYVMATAWLVRRWGEGGRRWAPVALAVFVACLVLFATVWPVVPLSLVRYSWAVHHEAVPDYEVAWSGLFARRDGEVTLQGLWMDLPVADEPLAGRDLRWTWGPAGWETEVRLLHGKPRVLWSLGTRRTEVAEGLEPGAGKLDSAWGWMLDRVDSELGLVFLERVTTDAGKREVELVLRWPWGA